MKNGRQCSRAGDRRSYVIHEALEVGAERLSVAARRTDSTVVFGFWIFLMTDFVLFASLFAVYAVLHGNTFGGPTGTDIFDAPYALIETLLLLTSSFTSGLSLLAAHREKKGTLVLLLGVTALLGTIFVGMEVNECSRFALTGSSPQMSGFLSSYFALVATHGLHVSAGILWMLALIVSLCVRGMTRSNMRKLLLISLFWHFLDIIWIFIFTIVYMMGIQ